MALTQSESRALLTTAILVLLAAVARGLLLDTSVGDVRISGLDAPADLDSALAVAESLNAEHRRRQAPLSPGERIDPNLADEVELDRLPGVGPALARAIVRSRRTDGPFSHLGDLERVPGLGPGTVARLASYVSLSRRAAVPRARGSSVRIGAATPKRDADGGRRVDVNRASAAELQALPGIGPARARAILRWREENGRFRTLDDLVTVPGIGPATVDRLRSRATARP